MKALGREQEKRWQEAFTFAGLPPKVVSNKMEVLLYVYAREFSERSQVIICTPDIIHAWFMSNLSSREVGDFYKEGKAFDC